MTTTLRCLTCNTISSADRVCGQCRAVHYCGKSCQQLDWRRGHKRVCKPYASALRLVSRFDHLVDDTLILNPLAVLLDATEGDTLVITAAALAKAVAGPTAAATSAIQEDFKDCLSTFYFKNAPWATPVDKATLLIYAQHCHFATGTCVGTLAKLLLIVTPIDVQRPGFSWESVDNPILAACRGPGCVATGKPGTKHAGACGHYFTQTL